MVVSSCCMDAAEKTMKGGKTGKIGESGKPDCPLVNMEAVLVVVFIVHRRLWGRLSSRCLSEWNSRGKARKKTTTGG